MRRRGFILNSLVLVMLIPLLLLLATYEDVSSQIIQAQSERVQVERSFRGIAYFDVDFQRALEISGKRAIIAAVDYVSVTGNFITSKPANETIKDLILFGNSPALYGYQNLGKIMQNQTIKKWLTLVRQKLIKQGFELSPDEDTIINNMELIVAPLDSFSVVIKARIPNVTITDLSGKIVYTGSIPKTADYVYAIIDLQNLEDPIFSAMTGGRYYRSIKACEYPYPELIERPLKVLEGNGSSSEPYVIGYFSKNVDPNYIYFGDFYPGNGAYAYVILNDSINATTSPIIVNTTIREISVSPTKVFEEGDRGVLVFGNVSSQEYRWYDTSLEYRINITITNNVGQDLVDYQIPILISSIKGILSNVLTQLFTNTQTDGNSDIYRVKVAVSIYDENGNRVSFWVEYWDATNQKALIWIKDSINAGQSKTYSLYFGSGTPVKGYNYNGNSLFIFFDDFEDGIWTDRWVQVDQSPTESNGELIINGGNNIEAIRTNDLNYDGSYAVRFRMRGTSATNNRDWDNGIEVEDSTDSLPNAYWVVRFIDDTRDLSDTLVVDEDGWWGSDATTANSARSGKPTDFHVYEAYMQDTNTWYDYNTKIYDAKFRDLTDGRVNYDSRDSLIDPPSLKYLYLVNDNDGSRNKGVYDFIFVRKYPDTNGDSLEDSTNFNGILLSTSDVESYSPPTLTAQVTSSKAYDITPFLQCISEQEGDIRYFGIYNAPSFFERLEGNWDFTRHEAYFNLSKQIQDELGIKYGNRYYPIGLVSFMIPSQEYDNKLFDLFNTLGIGIEEGQSSMDYYFLQYYFGSKTKVSGYRVLGISYGILSTDDLTRILLFLDNETATAIFGEQGACDLLEGYTCG